MLISILIYYAVLFSYFALFVTIAASLLSMGYARLQTMQNFIVHRAIKGLNYISLFSCSICLTINVSIILLLFGRAIF